MSWKVLKSQIIHKSKWINLYKQKIRIKKNLIINDYYKIVWKDAVIILPIINKKILVLRGYKKSLGYTFSFPSGYIEKKEKPMSAAYRELEEETNFKSKSKLKKVGSYIVSGNYFCGKVHIFLAKNLKPVLANNPDFENSKIFFFNKKKITDLIKNNQIKSQSSCHAFMLANLKKLI